MALTTSLTFFVTFGLFGLLSSFSPCLFPLLPSYVATAVRAKQSKKQAFISSLFLIMGILIVFFSIGLLSKFIGDFLFQNQSLFSRIQGSLLVIAGLIMIKPPSFIYNIRLPDKLQQAIYNEESAKNMYIFSFGLGLVYTIIAAPCAAGYFLAVWILLAKFVLVEQLFLVAAFSLGAGLPFIIMSLYLPQISGGTIGKIHSASSKVTLVLGLIFIAIGVWLIIDTSKISLIF